MQPLPRTVAASANNGCSHCVRLQVGLPDEAQKSLSLQPIIMKGHLLELDQVRSSMCCMALCCIALCSLALCSIAVFDSLVLERDPIA